MKLMKVMCSLLVAVIVGFGAGYVHSQTSIDNAPVIETVQLSDLHYSPTAKAMFVEDVPAAAPQVKTSTTTTTSTTQSAVLYILTNALSVLAVPIATILTALISILLVTIAKHFNIKISQAEHDLVTDYSNTAIMRAEAWAANRKDVPSGNDKLNFAVGAMRDLMNTSMGKTFTNEQLAHYAEQAVYKTFNQPLPGVTTTTETPDAKTTTTTTPPKV